MIKFKRRSPSFNRLFPVDEEQYVYATVLVLIKDLFKEWAPDFISSKPLVLQVTITPERDNLDLAYLFEVEEIEK